MTAVLAFRPTVQRTSAAFDALSRVLRDELPDSARYSLQASGLRMEVHVDLPTLTAAAFALQPDRCRMVVRAVNAVRPGPVEIVVRFRCRGITFAVERLAPLRIGRQA